MGHCLQIALNGRYQLAIQNASLATQPQAHASTMPAVSPPPAMSGAALQSSFPIRSLADVSLFVGAGL
jgi:hypothetical protein